MDEVSVLMRLRRLEEQVAQLSARAGLVWDDGTGGIPAPTGRCAGFGSHMTPNPAQRREPEHLRELPSPAIATRHAHAGAVLHAAQAAAARSASGSPSRRAPLRAPRSACLIVRVPSDGDITGDSPNLPASATRRSGWAT